MSHCGTSEKYIFVTNFPKYVKQLKWYIYFCNFIWKDTTCLILFCKNLRLIVYELFVKALNSNNLGIFYLTWYQHSKSKWQMKNHCLKKKKCSGHLLIKITSNKKEKYILDLHEIFDPFSLRFLLLTLLSINIIENLI